MKKTYWLLTFCLLSFFKPHKVQAQFEVIAVYPLSDSARLGQYFRLYGGTLKDVSPYSKTWLWAFPASFTSRIDARYSYSNRADGVERVRTGSGGTAGVSLPIEITENKPTFAPEGNFQQLSFQPIQPVPLLKNCPILNSSLVIKSGSKRIVTIAFIDSGVPCEKGGQTHPALKSVAWYNKNELTGSGTLDDDNNGYKNDIMGWDFVSNDFIPNDDNGHGTATASIVWNQFAQTGSISKLKILPLKVLDNEAKGTLFNLIKAIDYATEKKVDIMNISIISPDPTYYKNVTPIQYVIDLAKKENILVLAAAGNNGDEIDFTEKYVYPASTSNENTIVVGSTNCNLGVSNFSNYGSKNVDIFAVGEGVNIYWRPRGSEYLMALGSGTSYSTPMVTGIAALLATHQSIKNYSAIKKAITNSGTNYEFLNNKCNSRNLLNGPNALTSFLR